MNGYLTAFELQGIKSDYLRLLGSPEASDLIFEYQSPDTSGTPDLVFGFDAYGSTTTTVVSGGAACRGLQHIISPRNEDVLRWGILETGDAVFYLHPDLDLQVGVPGSLEIIDPAGVRWTPIPRNLKEFYNYLRARLGNSQIAQVIPAKLKR